MDTKKIVDFSGNRFVRGLLMITFGFGLLLYTLGIVEMGITWILVILSIGIIIKGLVESGLYEYFVKTAPSSLKLPPSLKLRRTGRRAGIKADPSSLKLRRTGKKSSTVKKTRKKIKPKKKPKKKKK